MMLLEKQPLRVSGTLEQTWLEISQVTLEMGVHIGFLSVEKFGENIYFLDMAVTIICTSRLLEVDFKTVYEVPATRDSEFKCSITKIAH